jgi:predicted nucleotide-binding protein
VKFHGTIEELKALVADAGLSGEWEVKPNNCFRYVQKNRAGLNWSASKGTIWFDGPELLKAQLEAAISAALDSPPVEIKEGSYEKRHVFVVHGHDSVAREQLELVLHKLGLEPFVLQNTDGGGLTIIESLEKMIGKNAESSFGIVLMTPDDVGYPVATGSTEAKPRARQNVVLEMGMLLASLTRDRVVILQKGFVETPSDVAGIIYLGFNNHVKETIPKLVGRLQKAGFVIDASKVASASS